MLVRYKLFGILIGAIAVLMSLSLAPASHSETVLGRIAVSLRPGASGTVLEIPPLGNVVADTHMLPVDIRVRLERLEVRRIGTEIVERDADSVIADARGALYRAFVVHGLVLAGFTAAAAWLLAQAFRRDRVRIVGGAVLVQFLVIVVVAASFDVKEFTSPSFRGPLREAPTVLRKLDSAITNAGAISDRLDAITTQLAALTEPVGGLGGTTVLHVSDLHSNPVGVTWVNELVTTFEVDAVVDTGDVTSFGYRDESAAIETPLQVPRSMYYVVYGNHDAPDVRERLSRRLDPLHGRVVEIGGVRILGFDDPTYTVKEGTDTPENAAKYRASGAAMREVCEREQPDVVAVHNPDQSVYVEQCAAVVISGHWHRQAQYRAGSAIVSVVGSTGGGGVEGLVPDALYHAELLRFDARGNLYAIDVLRMNPTSGEFIAERIDPNRVMLRQHR